MGVWIWTVMGELVVVVLVVENYDRFAADLARVNSRRSTRQNPNASRQ